MEQLSLNPLNDFFIIFFIEHAVLPWLGYVLLKKRNFISRLWEVNLRYVSRSLGDL